MKLPAPIKLAGFGLFMLVLISVFTAFSAGIVMPSSNVGTQSTLVSANSVKPDACIGFNLSNIVSGTGAVVGTPGNDLILGSSGTDTIDGLGGDDCILGGGGDDAIDGNNGTDICISGPGLDTFVNCEGEIQ